MFRQDCFTPNLFAFHNNSIKESCPVLLGTVNNKMSSQKSSSPDLLALLYLKFSINAVYFKTEGEGGESSVCVCVFQAEKIVHI